MSEIPKDKWTWYGTSGHYICAHRCLFHLCTKVGKYLVSTVGEMPSDPSDTDSSLVEIGIGRKYETMVFRWKGICKEPDCRCGMPFIIPSEIEMLPANQRGDAAKNHYKACLRYSRKQ